MLHAKHVRAFNAAAASASPVDLASVKTGSLFRLSVMDNFVPFLPTSTATRLLIVAGITMLAFTLSAAACDRLGYKIVSPFLAAGAWLCGAFAVLAWFWR
jgi:hypothetical protein